MKPIKMSYDLSKRKGSCIKSFVLRETTGEDEEVAAQSAKAKGGTASAAEELLRMSIVEVDGKPVAQPYLEFDKWNSKTRSYALAAWRSLNVVDDVEDFLSEGELVQD